MADLKGFDARTVEPTAEFDPLPAGKYVAAITESEMKPTKSGNGHYLQLTFTVLEGEFKNRVLWARLNLDNPNATTVKIARAELSAVCRAVGVMAPKDSVELHNLPLVITVGLKKRDDNGELTNVIKGYARKEVVEGQTPRAPHVGLSARLCAAPQVPRRGREIDPDRASRPEAVSGKAARDGGSLSGAVDYIQLSERLAATPLRHISQGDVGQPHRTAMEA